MSCFYCITNQYWFKPLYSCRGDLLVCFPMRDNQADQDGQDGHDDQDDQDDNIDRDW